MPPTIEEHLNFWRSLSEDLRMDFTAEAFQIVQLERLNLTTADEWETLGWLFAERAQTERNQDRAITAVGIAASMFAHAEHLRNPTRFS
jgi:hypothetical protein